MKCDSIKNQQSGTWIILSPATHPDENPGGNGGITHECQWVQDTDSFSRTAWNMLVYSNID
eukprot:64900-Rhodomonas_salina.1